MENKRIAKELVKIAKTLMAKEVGAVAFYQNAKKYFTPRGYVVSKPSYSQTPANPKKSVTFFIGMDSAWVYVNHPAGGMSSHLPSTMYRYCKSDRDFQGEHNQWIDIRDSSDLSSFLRRVGKMIDDRNTRGKQQ